jgi:hypothetical protein
MQMDLYSTRWGLYMRKGLRLREVKELKGDTAN